MRHLKTIENSKIGAPTCCVSRFIACFLCPDPLLKKNQFFSDISIVRVKKKLNSVENDAYEIYQSSDARNVSENSILKILVRIQIRD